MRLNAMTNALVREEVGRDDGSEYPGPTEQYNTVPPATRGQRSRKVR
jgi:arylsulfatase